MNKKTEGKLNNKTRQRKKILQLLSPVEGEKQDTHQKAAPSHLLHHNQAGRGASSMPAFSRRSKGEEEEGLDAAISCRCEEEGTDEDQVAHVRDAG